MKMGIELSDKVKKLDSLDGECYSSHTNSIFDIISQGEWVES